MVKFEYPLQWLPQQPRTKRPERARFSEKHSASRAGDELVNELERLGAKKCVISSNLQTRIDGSGFYAKQRIVDPGVVIYFDLKGQGKAMACDKWDKVEHNLWALYLSVQAIRGLERWGGSELLDGLFTGFKALPDPANIIITEKDYFGNVQDKEDLRIIYKDLVKKMHPDLGGSSDEFQVMKRQYEQRLGGMNHG